MDNENIEIYDDSELLLNIYNELIDSMKGLSEKVDLNPLIERIEKSIADNKIQLPEDRTEELINAIKNIKIPEAKNIDINKIVKAIKDNKVTVAYPDNTELIKSLDDIKEELEKEKQSPYDYVPFRRVREINGRMEFDDSYYGATSGGGSGNGLTNSELRADPVDVVVTDQPIQAIKATDSASIDAFSRWRVSEPNYVFDTNFQYDLQPLVYQAVTAEDGATVTHDSTNRNALMTFSSTPTGGKAYMQSYEWFRYQAGRSQLVFQTFNFIETKADTLKFVGYGDGNNGIELQLSGSTLQLVLYSDTAKGDETVAQANWNIDKMDGTGVSGKTVDVTKTQIFVIDFQWLGVGRIRCGLDIDGVLYYIHEFKHANVQSVAYMQTANLPIRAGMTCTGTVSTTMRYICASVSSEGGETDVGGYNFSVEGTVTASSEARTHILSVRPKTTFNSIENRTKFVLESVELLVTGNQPVEWELVLGQAISGTTSFNDVNATYSATEFNTAGTISGSPSLVIASGYVAASTQSKTTSNRTMANKYPITLDAAGAVRSMGTLSLIVTGLGGTSACRAVMNWREIR